MYPNKEYHEKLPLVGNGIEIGYIKMKLRFKVKIDKLTLKQYIKPKYTNMTYEKNLNTRKIKENNTKEKRKIIGRSKYHI